MKWLLVLVILMMCFQGGFCWEQKPAQLEGFIYAVMRNATPGADGVIKIDPLSKTYNYQNVASLGSNSLTETIPAHIDGKTSTYVISLDIPPALMLVNLLTGDVNTVSLPGGTESMIACACTYEGTVWVIVVLDYTYQSAILYSVDIETTKVKQLYNLPLSGIYQYTTGVDMFYYPSTNSLLTVIWKQINPNPPTVEDRAYNISLDDGQTQIGYNTTSGVYYYNPAYNTEQYIIGSDNDGTIVTINIATGAAQIFYYFECGAGVYETANNAIDWKNKLYFWLNPCFQSAFPYLTIVDWSNSTQTRVDYPSNVDIFDIVYFGEYIPPPPPAPTDLAMDSDDDGPPPPPAVPPPPDVRHPSAELHIDPLNLGEGNRLESPGFTQGN